MGQARSQRDAGARSKRVAGVKAKKHTGYHGSTKRGSGRVIPCGQKPPDMKKANEFE